MSANLHVDYGNTMYFVNSLTVGTTAVISQGASGFSSGTASQVSLGSGIAVVGQWIDMSNSDTFTGVYVSVVGGVSGVIPIAVQTAPGINDFVAGNLVVGNIGSGWVLSSGYLFSGGSPASGWFTDPTSGLSQLPTWFQSGGILYVNSGLYTVPGGATGSGYFPNSGGTGGSVTGRLVAGYPAYTLPFGPTPIQNAQGGNAGEGNLSGSFPQLASGGIAFANFQRNYQYARLVLLSGATLLPAITAGFVAQLMTTGSGPGYSYSPQLAGAGILV